MAEDIITTLQGKFSTLCPIFIITNIDTLVHFRKMESIDLVSKATVDDLIFQKFESPLPRSQDDDDPFIKGEFDVIKELLEKLPASIEGKKKVDRVIDICGPLPKGTGAQNLRECIIETKWKYDVASEDKQVAWKALILNFMERYFYLICFATYALEFGPSGYPKSFVSWMDDHKELRTMIGEFILITERVNDLDNVQTRVRTSWSGTGQWMRLNWSISRR